MRKSLYIVLCFSVFLLTGELIFRVENYLVDHEVLDVKPNQDNSDYNPLAESTKLLLLGDSYTKGLGIKESDRIFNQLKEQSFGVIDSSTSGDNWTDYYRKIVQFQHMDTLDFIVIGVNWNDVDFPVGQIVNFTNPDIASPGELEHDNTKNGTRRFISNIYNSKLVSTLSSFLQYELKRAGYPLPIGHFHYFRTQAYKEHHQDFEVVYSKLSELISAYDLKVTLYLMPDFNLLNRPEYFRTFINEFSFNQSNIYVINGLTSFMVEGWRVLYFYS